MRTVFWVKNLEGKKSLERPKRRREDNVTMVVRETG